MTVELLDHEIQISSDITNKVNQLNLSRTNILLNKNRQDLHYPHFSSKGIREELLNLQKIIPEDDPSWKHKIMTMSDLELAAKKDLDSLFLQEHEAKGAIRGVSGHEISVITNELLRAYLRQDPLNAVPYAYHPPDDKIQIIKASVEQTLTNYNQIKMENIVDISCELWQKLRELHLFTYGKHNRKTIERGSLFSPMWVHDYWVSDEMKKFETNIFEINRNRITNYLSDLFDEFSFLPLESNPEVLLESEKPVILHVEFGSFRIQFKGRIDYAIHDFLAIDTKFGSPDTLFSPVNRIQSLLYSHVLKHGNFNKGYVVDLDPSDTLFYYHVYDTKAAVPSSFYVDATVYPNEYVGVLDNLCVLASEWVANYEEFKHIKETQETAVVLPFLASPN